MIERAGCETKDACEKWELKKLSIPNSDMTLRDGKAIIITGAKHYGLPENARERRM